MKLKNNKTESEEERKTRYEKNHKEMLEELKQKQFNSDYEHTKNDRRTCTCHACQRMIERGYAKMGNDWVVLGL